MNIKATSKTKFSNSHTTTPSKKLVFHGRVIANALNIRTWAGTAHDTCTFSPLSLGNVVAVCDAIQAVDGKTWYYVEFGGKYGFVSAQYIQSVPDIALAFIGKLQQYHLYIKDHYKYFIRHYDSSIDTFAKAKTLVKQKKIVGITCVVPCSWGLHELGIRRIDGKSLVSGNEGTFKQHYTGDIKKYMTRITSGGAIGLSVSEAVKKNLLQPGDIIAYENITHTSVYSGKGCIVYEGGRGCLVGDHYPNGIVKNYEKGYKDRLISEILRWK